MSDLWCHRLSHYLRNSSVGHLLLLSRVHCNGAVNGYRCRRQSSPRLVHGSASLEHWRGGGQGGGELWPPLRSGTHVLSHHRPPMRAIVRQRYRRLVRPARGLEPGRPTAQPVLALRRALEHRTRSMHQQTAQVVPALADAQQHRLAPAAVLLGHQPQAADTSRPRRNCRRPRRRGTRSPPPDRTIAFACTARVTSSHICSSRTISRYGVRTDIAQRPHPLRQSVGRISAA